MFTLRRFWISIKGNTVEAPLPDPEPIAPSPTASTPAAKSSTPALPPELVADIIDLTVELLVKEERTLVSQTPITNHFLLSAMLVDRTWNSIAVSALMKNGLVTPANVDLFIAQVRSHQLESTLESVRFGLGSAGLDDARDGSEDDARFEALVGSLPGLKRLEVSGGGLSFKPKYSERYCKLDQVLLSNSGLFESRIFHKLLRNRPSKLVIYETRPWSKIEDSPASHTDAAVRYMLLDLLEEISISSNQVASSMSYLTRIAALGVYNPIGLDVAHHLRTFHLDCTDHEIIPAAREIADVLKLYFPGDLAYPFLTHLASYLEILHFLATSGARPNLASLDVLKYPVSREYKVVVTVKEAERMLLELVDLPVLAKLKVPACWRNDAVEGACEAKGIDLRWT